MVQEAVAIDQAVREGANDIRHLRRQQALCDPDFLNKVIIHGRRPLTRLKTAGKTLTKKQVVETLDRLRKRLKHAYAVTLSDASFDIVVRELSKAQSKIFGLAPAHVGGSRPRTGRHRDERGSTTIVFRAQDRQHER